MTRATTRQRYDVKSRWFMFTCVFTRAIITEVGCLPTKGGCCDNDGGILDSRGGVKRTESFSLHGSGDVTRWRDARPQVWHEMAYQQNRVRGVETREAESVQEAVSGKLNSSSAATSSYLSIGTRFGRSRCTSLLRAHFTMHRQIASREWHVAAGGGIYPHE